MPRIVEAFWDAELGPVPGIDGTNGADFLWGTDAAESIYGHGGNDRLKGCGGADWLDGGTGIDTVYYADSTAGVAVNLATGHGYGGSAEGDTLISIEYVFGSFHNDTITGNDANNELYGLTGNDILKGGGGADGLAGDDGDDFLKGGGGADYLEGGDGIDTADYSAASSYDGNGVTVYLYANQAVYGEAHGDTFSSIENITGSAYADHLYGDNNRNVLRGLNGVDRLYGLGGDDLLEGGDQVDFLYGGHGHDTLDGGDQNDFLYGGNGDDTLDGGSGADSMLGDDHGQAGNDTYIVDNALDQVWEYLGHGVDTVRARVSYALAPDSEVETLASAYGSTGLDLTGSNTANEIIGDDGDNRIDGRGGADQLRGLGGNDLYVVDNAADAVTENASQGFDEVRSSVSYVLTAGADVEILCTTDDAGVAPINLTGNASGNLVRGNNGANVINGGAGNDTLTGLGGQDSFLFATALDAAFNVDVVADFSVADDTILLDDAIFAAFANGPLADARFVVGTAALDANDNIIYNAATGALLYDVDGTGAAAAVQFAQLSAGLALTNQDFLVV